MKTGLMRRPFMRLAEAWRGIWSGPITSSSPELARLWAAPPSSTGVSVSEQTALAYSAFWACVNAISTDVASLPLMLYKRLPNGGKTRFDAHNLFQLLHDEPNDEAGSMTFRETLTAHALTWGNGYAEIERDGAGRPAALWPLTPDRVQPIRDRRTNGIVYMVAPTNPNEPAIVIPAADMFHVHGLGFDGLLGYSVVAKAREAIGLGLATERFGGTFFGNGSTFGGVISYPGPRPTELSEKNYRETLDGRHQGVDRAHKLLAIYNGAKFERNGIPPNDAQFLETRLHQIEEMCRWFRMPPHKIQHLLRATNNNIEHQGIEYSTDTLHPWCVRWEQEINRKLIARAERKIQFAEHLIEGKLRGDLASRYAAYAVGRQWGWLSADDVREKENLNPLPNGQGQIYLVPQNMAPANQIGALIEAQIKAKTVPPDPSPTPGAPTESTNALAMVETIRAALTEAELRAEGHLTRAIAHEADAVRWKGSADTFQAEAATERAAAATATQEVQALQALLLEATARIERELAAREAEAASTAAQEVRDQATLLEATARGDRELAAREAATQETSTLRAELLEATARVDRELAERAALTAATTAAQDERDQAQAAVATARAAQQQADTERDQTRVALTAAEARIAAEAVVTAETAVALATLRETEHQRLIAVIGAHRGLIADAMGRMIRRETEKARRAQATPEKLRHWIETFYPTHDDICRAALLPAIRAHLAWQQSAADPAVVTQTIVTAHIAESIRQLHLVLDSDPEDVPMTLETTLRHWELERADALADEMLRDDIDYARRTR